MPLPIRLRDPMLVGGALGGVIAPRGKLPSAAPDPLLVAAQMSAPSELLQKLSQRSYKDEILADSPWLYYRLGDWSSVAVDSSGNARGGTYTTYSGSNKFQDGLLIRDPDACIAFTGNGGAVQGPTTNFPGTLFAMEILFSDDLTGSGNRYIISKWQGGVAAQSVGIEAATFIWYLSLNTGDVAISFANSLLAAGTHHLFCVWDGTANGLNGGIASIYVDGVLMASSITPIGATFVGTANAWTVGQRADKVGSAGINFFGGKTDEFALYSTAPSPERIAAHSKAALGTFLAPRMYLPLEYLQKISSTSGSPSEGGGQAQQTTSEPMEALGGIKATASDPQEAPQKLAITGTLPEEALQKISTTISMVGEFLQKLAATVSLPEEALGGIRALATEIIEALQPITRTGSLPAEADTGVRATNSEPGEFLQRLAATESSPIEAEGTVQATASTRGEILAALAGTAGLFGEYLARLLATASAPEEAAGGLAATSVVPAETLAKLAVTGAIFVESYLGVSRTVAAPGEYLGRLAASTVEPAESQASVVATALMPEEALRGLSALSPSLVGEILQRLAALASEPVEAAARASSTVSLPAEELALLAAQVAEPGEFLKVLGAVAVLPAESISTGSSHVSALAPIQIEILGPVSTQAAAPEETLARIAKGAAAPVDASAGIAATITLPLEELAKVTGSAALALEALQELRVVVIIPVDSTQGQNPGVVIGRVIPAFAAESEDVPAAIAAGRAIAAVVASIFSKEAGTP